MPTEPFLINPPKRLPRRLRHWSFVPAVYRNPVGETLITVGGNPMADRSRRLLSLRRRYIPARQRRAYEEVFREVFGTSFKSPKYGAIHRRLRVSRDNPVTRTGLYYPRKGSAEAKEWGRRMRAIREMYRRLGISSRRRRRKNAMDNPLKYVGVIEKLGPGNYHYKLVGTRARSGKLKGKIRKDNPRRRYDNAWYDDIMGHRKAALKGWKRRRRRMRLDNPRRRYRRYRRNPAITVAGTFQQIMDVGTWFPLAVTGGLSVTTAAVLPQMIAPGVIAQPVTGPLVKYGIQLVTTFVGGGLVTNFVGSKHGNAWMITGVAYIGYQLLRDWVFKPFLPQFAVGLGEYEQYYSASEPFQQVGENATGYGVGAYPEEVSAFPENVSAYPYDGSYGY